MPTETIPAEWAQFQKDVADLFEIAGYQVQRDILIDHKKVDVFVAERRLGKQHRSVVECKCWDKKLSQKDITEIYANYLPLIPGSADEILIISKQGVFETAAAMIATSPHLRHLTYAEFHANIMDFKQYLTRMIDQYSDDGLNTYYVPPRSSDDRNLREIVDEWVIQDDPQPLAILGSYGLGKTTLARAVAYEYALRATKDPTARIPILIKLGEIANEQSLEGLLGKLFTATNHVKYYNFSTFIELNKLGRFLVIYDGFDEMKQTLSWNDFKFNLHELNRLVSPKSRVMILGRPTAFMSDAEHNYALHGIRMGSSYELRDPEWPDYVEIEIAHFSRFQMKEFLQGYLGYLISTTPHQKERDRFASFLNYDIDNLIGGKIGDIAKRPVQLKMITEILPDYHGKLSGLTIHELYDYFVDYVIERESFKLARKRFTTPQRRAFASEVAYWLWGARDRSISEQNLPAALIQPFKSPGEDDESVTRDLVAACVLDRRVGGRLFFPHRSIQEFLVAEAVNKRVLQKEIQVQEICSALTPEVSDFLEGFAKAKFLASMSNLLSAFRGKMSLALARLIFRSPWFIECFSAQNIWSPLLSGLAISEHAGSEYLFSDMTKGVLEKTNEPKIAISVLLSALAASRKWKDATDKQPSRMICSVLEQLCKLATADLRMRKRRTGRASYEVPSMLPVVEILRSLVFIRSKADSTIQLSATYKALEKEIREFCYVSDWDRDGKFRPTEAGFPDRVSDKNSSCATLVRDCLDEYDRGRR